MRRPLKILVGLAAVSAATMAVFLSACDQPVQAAPAPEPLVYDVSKYEARQQLITRWKLTRVRVREARQMYAPLQIYLGKLSRLCAERIRDPRCSPELILYGLIVQAGDERARNMRLDQAQRAQLDAEMIEAYDELAARGLFSLTAEQAAQIAAAQAGDQPRDAISMVPDARERQFILLSTRDALRRKRAQIDQLGPQ